MREPCPIPEATRHVSFLSGTDNDGFEQRDCRAVGTPEKAEGEAVESVVDKAAEKRLLRKLARAMRPPPCPGGHPPCQLTG